ncbi:MAG: DUF4349 domain-containing protein [Methanomicrobiales archaeon]|nr:DUF4349 domain-containing protein [Methanomicrobiales archaeon]
MIRRSVLLGVFLVMVLLSAGCLTTPWEGDFATGSEKSDGQYETSPISLMSGNSPGWSGIVPDRTQTPALVPAAERYPDLAANQMIIKTSQIRLEVQNVTATLDPIRSIATIHGGYVGSLSVNTQYADRLYGTVTLRIPAREFEAAIAEIKMLGTLKSESLSAEDVTEEYVDLQARRTALANQLVQYTRIMEKAENVSEILDVQIQIERVQVEIDRIDGRLKYLDNRVEYATITVTLTEPEPVGGREGFSFISAINEGIAGFLAVTAGLVVILISIIPLVILGAVVYLVYRWWKRRKGQAAKQPDVRQETREEQPPGTKK